MTGSLPEIRDIMDNFDSLAADAAVRATYKKAPMQQVLKEVAEIMEMMGRLTEILVELRRERREMQVLTNAEEAACNRREQRVEQDMASAERRLRKAVNWLESGWHWAHTW